MHLPPAADKGSPTVFYNAILESDACRLQRLTGSFRVSFRRAGT